MRPFRPTAGFTLLELLASVAITLVLAGLLLTITRNSLGLWQRTRGGLETAAQARLVLDLLERDLQGAVHRADGGRWLAVDIIDSPGPLSGHGWLVQAGMKPGGPESLRIAPADPNDTIVSSRFGLSGCWLRMVATNLEGGTAFSSPVVISYQLARRPVTGSVSAANPAEIRYRLYRTAVSTSLAFNHGYDVRAVIYSTPSSSPGGERSTLAVYSPSNQEALADNVVDFGVWLHAGSPDGGLRRTYPTGSGHVAHTAPADDEFPATVDVMVRILSAEGASRLATIESGRVLRPPGYATDAAWWWAVAESNSRVFVRRISLKGGPW
jgi:type II secretory pathway pseudopilin PulG